MGLLPSLNYPFDALTILRKRKALRRELLQLKDVSWLKKRIAVLGGSSTQDIVSTLDLFLLNEGILAEFYEAQYGLYREEILFDNPKLEEFHPDLLIFHTTWRNLRNLPSPIDSAEMVLQHVKEEKQQWRELWENAERRYHCAIIQNNFELPPYRLLGNRDSVEPQGGVAFIQALNTFFQSFARSHSSFYLHDLAYLAADYGLTKWHNNSVWHLYKYALAIEAIPTYAYSLASLIRALWGKSKKALNLDLDNTIWGGVIGDDGVDGLILGQDTAQGAAYQEWQDYLRKLSQLGILLTVNSKNEKSNALSGLQHPQSHLSPDNFALLKANWQPKDRNLLETAKELNINTDAFVFVDDNPAERALINASLPQVVVPAMDKIENYIHLLDRGAWFEPIHLTQEDLTRNKMYRENMRREAEQQTFADYSNYLASLQMRACIGSITPAQISRVAQLTNKTNQFNFTTKRYTEAEIRDMTENPSMICLAGTLSDKFGDNGLVTVMLGKIDSIICDIDLWLMSCRVFKRGLEKAMLNVFFEQCKQRGVQKVRGIYKPTAKNALVADLFLDFGFHRCSTLEDDSTTWEISVADYHTLPTYIQIEEHF